MIKSSKSFGFCLICLCPEIVPTWAGSLSVSKAESLEIVEAGSFTGQIPFLLRSLHCQSTEELNAEISKKAESNG